jgi:hypothetical protein
MMLPAYLIIGTRKSSSTNQVDAITIRGDGKVGIGTNSPEMDLHIKDGNNGEVKIGGSSSATGLEIRYSNTGVTTTNIHQVYRSTSGSALLNIDTGIFTVSTGTAGDEKLRLDSSGRLLVGTSSSTNTVFVDANLQLKGNNYNGGSAAFIVENNSNGDAAPNIYLARTAGAGGALVSNGYSLGAIQFIGGDGTDYNSRAARIQCFVDGTPGADDMPGRLVFSTTSDGASGPTERLRIDSSGRLGIGTTTPSSYSAAGDNLVIADAGNCGITLAAGTSSTGQILFADGTTGADTIRGIIGYTHASNDHRWHPRR